MQFSQSGWHDTSAVYEIDYSKVANSVPNPYFMKDISRSTPFSRHLWTFIDWKSSFIPATFNIITCPAGMYVLLVNEVDA